MAERGTDDIFCKIRPKEVFDTIECEEYWECPITSSSCFLWQLEILQIAISQSVQLRLGGIGTCYNNNIDKYGTKGGGKGFSGQERFRVNNEGVSMIAAVAILRSYQVLAWGEI